MSSKLAYAGIGAGTLYMWSGLKGWSITATIADIASGRPPAGKVTNPIRGGTPSQSGAGTAGGSATPSGSALADDALTHRGHSYLFGGAPGRDGSRPWDCSSFVNWEVSHLGGSIPGYGPGKYDGSVHGPPTGVWGAWPGLKRISRAEVQAGDIIVWAFHMGIAISNAQMISAQDPADGTKVGPIDGGGNGPLLKYGRL